MRVSARAISGLGTVPLSAPVPPSDGVSIATAKKACGIALGTWDESAGGCRLPDPQSPPDWCSWVPFSGMMEACKLPTAQDLTGYGSYTAYKIAQKAEAACQPTWENGRLVPAPAGCKTTGEQAAQTIMVVSNQQSVALVDEAGCAYEAAAKHPTLAQMFGPDVTCSLVDPFNTNGWAIYLVAGVAVALTFSIVWGRR